MTSECDSENVSTIIVYATNNVRTAIQNGSASVTLNIINNVADSVVVIPSGEEPTNIIVCDGNILNLQCGQDQVISLNTVIYGQQDSVTCKANCTQYATPDICAQNSTNCISTTATDALNSICNNLQACSINVNSGSFNGNPCSNIYKYLQVDYQCIPATQELTIKVCDFDDLSISCSNGKMINIISVFYGRTDSTTCTPACVKLYPTSCLSKRLSNTNCDLSQQASDTITSACNNKSSCFMAITSETLNVDPCDSTTYMYATVKYVCI